MDHLGHSRHGPWGPLGILGVLVIWVIGNGYRGDSLPQMQMKMDGSMTMSHQYSTLPQLQHEALSELDFYPIPDVFIPITTIVCHDHDHDQKLVPMAYNHQLQIPFF